MLPRAPLAAYQKKRRLVQNGALHFCHQAPRTLGWGILLGGALGGGAHRAASASEAPPAGTGRGGAAHGQGAHVEAGGPRGRHTVPVLEATQLATQRPGEWIEIAGQRPRGCRACSGHCHRRPPLSLHVLYGQRAARGWSGGVVPAGDVCLVSGSSWSRATRASLPTLQGRRRRGLSSGSRPFPSGWVVCAWSPGGGALAGPEGLVRAQLGGERARLRG